VLASALMFHQQALGRCIRSFNYESRQLFKDAEIARS
jgi:hypothetical protein